MVCRNSISNCWSIITQKTLVIINNSNQFFWGGYSIYSDPSFLTKMLPFNNNNGGPNNGGGASNATNFNNQSLIFFLTKKKKIKTKINQQQ